MQSYEFHVSETGAASAGNDACADTAADASVSNGLSGRLRLQNVQSLGQEDILRTIESLEALMGWAQAQQARAVTRLEALVSRELDPEDGSLDGVPDQTAFRLTASEIGALLSLPPMTAQRLVVDSSTLCSECPSVLAELEAGRLSYRKAQIICSTVVSLPEPTRIKLENRLLREADGLTAAQLERRARRLYEGIVPESELVIRHRQARNDRRVCLEPQLDGMCFLSARLPAPVGQAVFTGLTTCARSEQAAGDPRTVDQLRADIFTSLLLGSGGTTVDERTTSGSPRREHPGFRTVGERATSGSASSDDTSAGPTNASSSRPSRRPAGPLGPLVKAEVMVLINAETLLGLDNRPAELHGYGPISAESARELVRSIGHWTGLLQDGRGEILQVGRQRRVPPGLRRWLQARDATCRFPGCSANALTAEIDHTVPWARGGPTEHGNLECLCRKHHALKTAGFWTARQPQPGVIEWMSPAGRKYRTRAHLDLSGNMSASPEETVLTAATAASEGSSAAGPLVGVDVPPPF
ncbi:HNH endonuclease signature motif containing protein [Arthrobacter sp. zg-Y769]|uniref:HNH endonuclease signature motif containing protein n=1 Tax=Arthrobacter sp. zg-Y769 TaxID=2894191 RepID=UPI001E2D905A|nr:HNH endonuclease signature motif containing protein [Arthrobacter sp. zg-Y769]MCC9206250.1 HNH endonuclease [Arthrobacter sp. zg-Y769]